MLECSQGNRVILLQLEKCEVGYFNDQKCSGSWFYISSKRHTSKSTVLPNTILRNSFISTQRKEYHLLNQQHHFLLYVCFLGEVSSKYCPGTVLISLQNLTRSLSTIKHLQRILLPCDWFSVILSMDFRHLIYERKVINLNEHFDCGCTYLIITPSGTELLLLWYFFLFYKSINYLHERSLETDSICLNARSILKG